MASRAPTTLHPALWASLGILLVAAVVWLASSAFQADDQPRADNAGETRDALATARTILCTGDSYTYGLGVKDPDRDSFPAQLEQLLNAGPAESWTVINRGRPGQSARDVLSKLDAQIERFRPEIVYVLVGCMQADAGEDPSPPASDVEAAPNSEDRSFVGHWYSTVDGAELIFEADGRFVLGAKEHRWEVWNNQLHIVLPELAMPASWAVSDGQLLLQCGFWSELQLFESGSPPLGFAKLQIAWQAMREERTADAIPIFAQAAADPTTAASALEGLVAAHTGSDSELTARYLDDLRAIYARDRDRKSFEPFIRALRAAGRDSEALEVAYGHLETAFSAPGAWPLIAQVGGTPEHRVRTIEALQRAAAGATQQPLAMRVKLLHALYGLEYAHDRVGSLRWLLEASALEGADGLVVRHILDVPQLQDKAAFEAVLNQAQITPEQRARLQGTHERAITSKHYADLEPDLRSIVERCHAHDTQIAFLNYPVSRPDFEAVLSRVCADLDVTLIDVRAEFVELLRTRSATELFSADGFHCTSESYRVIARLLRGDVRAR